MPERPGPDGIMASPPATAVHWPCPLRQVTIVMAFSLITALATVKVALTLRTAVHHGAQAVALRGWDCEAWRRCESRDENAGERT